MGKDVIIACDFASKEATFAFKALLHGTTLITACAAS